MFTTQELKTETELFLTLLLKNNRDLLSRIQRDITVLAMCGFACHKVLEELIGEEALKRIAKENQDV